MADKQVFVYVDLASGPAFVGRLWSRFRNRRESATFEYDAAWLTHPERFALEPALALDTGPQHTAQDQRLFGALGDSAPDRWGRVLMRRDEQRRAKLEQRPSQTLGEIDYLLLVDDEARQGALRFALQMGGPFLAEDPHPRIPPLVELPRLLAAGQRVAADSESDEDIRLLLVPGSSLGGARPKAVVRDGDKGLTIAKFPHPNDDYDLVKWEAVALHLASRAGIDVPDWRLEAVSNKTVLLLRRFDRAGSRRTPFLSAMSMLGRRDHEVGSYLEMVDALSQHGARPTEDAQALWRRIVFSLLISNTDDHLRNHGFIYAGALGWQLSPAYDLNPTPTDLKARILTTSILPDVEVSSLDSVLENAEYFRLTNDRANEIVREVAQAVAEWRSVAAGIGLTSAAIERMSSAFDHADLEAAKRVGRA